MILQVYVAQTYRNKIPGGKTTYGWQALKKLERSGPIFVFFFSYLKALICFLAIKLLPDLL